MALGQAILVASDYRLIFCGSASDPALGQMLIEEYSSWTLEQPNDPVYSVSLPRFEPRASQHQPARLLFCHFLSLCLGSPIFFRAFCSQTFTVVVRTGEVRLSNLYPKATKAAKI
jgi:hypothetical protein